MNEWTHLAFTFDQNLTNKIYINANLTISDSWHEPFNNITRIYNYVGRVNDPDITDINGIIDELKIFNRALTQQEIHFEMNNV